MPRLLIPWTPFFLFAVVDYVRELIRAVAKQGTASVEDLSSRKQGSKDTLWLFASIVFIFVLFSASRSRRSYYILPAVPWCILFTAAWFSEPAETRSFLRKLTDVFAKLVDVLIPVVVGLLILVTASLMYYAAVSPAGMGRLFRPLLYWDDLKHVMFFLLPFGFISGIVWLVVWRRSRKKLLREGGEGAFAPSADPLNRAVPFVAFMMFTVFSVVIPTFGDTDSFDPDRLFCRFIRFDLKRLTKLDPGFLKRTAYFGSVGHAELTFFLQLPEPIRTFSLEKLDDSNRTFISDTVVIEGPDEFRVFLADVLEHGGMVITRGDWVDALEESEECRDIVKILRGEEMVFRTSDLTRIQEHTLEKLKEKPGWQDDPKSMRKIRKMNEKRICIFYHLPESIAEEVPMTPESWFGSSADQPLIDGTEGTKQP